MADMIHIYKKCKVKKNNMCTSVCVLKKPSSSSQFVPWQKFTNKKNNDKIKKVFFFDSSVHLLLLSCFVMIVSHHVTFCYIVKHFDW
jgi:hypothetical protein